MTEVTLKPKPFEFLTDHEHAFGVLLVGWKKLPVTVLSYSWAGYTLEVNYKTSKLLERSRSAQLMHQGSKYDVSFVAKERRDKNLYCVQLTREEDKTIQSKLNRRRKIATSPTLALNQRDPILRIAFIFFVILMLLMMPGWGERWGTSNYFLETVASIGRALGFSRT
jgi:hypothetical protein